MPHLLFTWTTALLISQYEVKINIGVFAIFFVSCNTSKNDKNNQPFDNPRSSEDIDSEPTLTPG